MLFITGNQHPEKNVALLKWCMWYYKQNPPEVLTKKIEWYFLPIHLCTQRYAVCLPSIYEHNQKSIPDAHDF